MKSFLFVILCITFFFTACTQQKITDPSEITFRINGDSVEVMQGEKVLQTLACDYTPDDEKLIAEDYDFDGYADLFVMMEDGAMYAPGTYFRFCPDTGLYETWDELNAIGRQMIPHPEDGTLMLRKTNSDYWIEYFVYKWENGSLTLTEHAVSEDGETFAYLSVNE